MAVKLFNSPAATATDLQQKGGGSKHRPLQYSELDNNFRDIYPIGSVYMNATNGENPATLLGFGNWERITAGLSLLGIDTQDPKDDVTEKTNGVPISTFGTLPTPSDSAMAVEDVEWCSLQNAPGSRNIDAPGQLGKTDFLRFHIKPYWNLDRIYTLDGKGNASIRLYEKLKSNPNLRNIIDINKHEYGGYRDFHPHIGQYLSIHNLKFLQPQFMGRDDTYYLPAMDTAVLQVVGINDEDRAFGDSQVHLRRQEGVNSHHLGGPYHFSDEKAKFKHATEALTVNIRERQMIKNGFRFAPDLTHAKDLSRAVSQGLNSYDTGLVGDYYDVKEYTYMSAAEYFISANENTIDAYKDIEKQFTGLNEGLHEHTKGIYIYCKVTWDGKTRSQLFAEQSLEKLSMDTFDRGSTTDRPYIKIYAEEANPAGVFQNPGIYNSPYYDKVALINANLPPHIHTFSYFNSNFGTGDNAIFNGERVKPMERGDLVSAAGGWVGTEGSLDYDDDGNPILGNSKIPDADGKSLVGSTNPNFLVANDGTNTAGLYNSYYNYYSFEVNDIKTGITTSDIRAQAEDGAEYSLFANAENDSDITFRAAVSGKESDNRLKPLFTSEPKNSDTYMNLDPYTSMINTGVVGTGPLGEGTDEAYTTAWQSNFTFGDINMFTGPENKRRRYNFANNTTEGRYLNADEADEYIPKLNADIFRSVRNQGWTQIKCAGKDSPADQGLDNTPSKIVQGFGPLKNNAVASHNNLQPYLAVHMWKRVG